MSTEMWYVVYCNVSHKNLFCSNFADCHYFVVCMQMSMTAVKEYLYKLSSDICETRHNIMHSMFLVLQSSPSLNFEALANAQKVFTSLFNRHLSEQHEVNVV